MKRGLSFGFVSLIIVFVLALFLVSGFSFKTFTGKITGNAVGGSVQFQIPSGQTGTATCLANGYASCSGTFYYLDGILTSDDTYLCSDAKIYSSEILPHWAECVPVSSGGDNSGNKITAPSTCNDGTPVGALGSTYGNVNYQYLCADKKGVNELLICGDQDFNYNPADQSTYTNPNVGAQLHGWTCERWGWLCGGKVSPSGSGYCCNNLNTQTPCLSITSITPSTSSSIGTSIAITIKGNNFGTTIGNSVSFIKSEDKVKIPLTTITSWTNEQIIVSTPVTLTAGTYNLIVQRSDGANVTYSAFILTDNSAFDILFKSCENYYGNPTAGGFWNLPIPYDNSLLVACDNVKVNCFDKNRAVYNGKCYFSTNYKADFHRTVQKDVGFSDGNDKIALTYNINGNPDPYYFGKWIDCDTTQEHCTACDNEIPISWTNDVNKNLDTSNNAGGILNCVGSQCWIKSGETSVGEYKTQTQAGCCGDDPNEYFRTNANGKSACCNNATDIVGADGQCLPLGTIVGNINPNSDCTCAIYDFVKDGIVDIEDVNKIILCKDNPSQTGCPSIKKMDIDNNGRINDADIKNMSNLCFGAPKLLSKDCDYDAINCQGCILGSNCIKAGTRANLGNSARYCSVNNHWLLPQSEGVSCSNDYECVTNVCVDGKCLSIKKELEKQAGLLKQIWCWLQHPLSATERATCYSAS